MPLSHLLSLLALSINSLLLIPLYKIVFSKMPIFQLNIVQFEGYHFALVFINLSIASLLSFKNGIDYLGQVATLSLQGMLVWLPSIILFAITQQLPLFIVYTNLVLGTIFLLFDYIKKNEIFRNLPNKKMDYRLKYHQSLYVFFGYVCVLKCKNKNL
ncbi:MAG: hypothetical protein IPI52_00325 [Bacteroidetes bacterium]|nr:hypothetical protein [Bacteroidota bacterium]